MNQVADTQGHKKLFGNYRMAVTFFVIFVISCVGNGIQYYIDWQFQHHALTADAIVKDKFVEAARNGVGKDSVEYYNVLVLNYKDRTIKHNTDKKLFSFIEIGKTVPIKYLEHYPGLVRVQLPEEKADLRTDINDGMAFSAIAALLTLLSCVAGFIADRKKAKSAV